ncbi:MAG TPA: hypothetical protein VN253_28015 [Kofleriaceae bacterium]|nr:hypothetical protein [Kofleriaceae bacterium]
MDPPLLPPELLEKMRAIGLRLDRAGTFWHEGTAVTHPRLRQALLRWFDVRDDGRDIVRLDDKRYAYVEIEDAHLRARSARWDGDRCRVLWDDDQEEELDYEHLRQAPDHALYTRARGRLRGRIAGPAYHAIAERVVEDDGAFWLPAAGRRWRIDRSETFARLAP